MFKRDKSLNEKRLECAIKSMALVAHYVAGADKKFDEKEREKASELMALSSNWQSLFYTEEEEELEDDQRSNLEKRLHEALDELDGETGNRSGLKAKLDKQYQIASTLFKYSYEDLEKMDRKKLLKIVDSEKLEIDVSLFDDDEDGLEYLMEEVNENLIEPFPYLLKDVLAQYGTYISMASGGFFGYKQISEVELKALEEIETSWGGTGFSLTFVMMQAKAIYKHREKINKAIKKAFG